MSFLRNLSEDPKKAALIGGAIVVGGAITYYLWDRYSTEDQQEWSAKKKEAAANMDKFKQKVAVHNADKTSNAAVKSPAPVVATTKAAPVVATTVAPVLATQSTTVTPATTTVTPTGTATTATKTTTTTLEQPTVVHTETEPVLKKIKERQPVVQEVIHPVELEEVQPVIYREVRKVEVHQVTQPIYEEHTAPVKEFNRELVAEHRPTLYADNTEYTKEFESGLPSDSQKFEATRRTQKVLAPIIEEVVKTDIIEVIQPVIHRDTVAATVIHTSQPIFEKVREQPTVVHETRSPLILTHDEVARLQAAKEAEQLQILEKYSDKQLAHGVVDRTYEGNGESTTIVVPAVAEQITTTETVTVETTVLPAGSISQ